MVVPTAKQSSCAHDSNINRNLNWNDAFLTQLHDGGNPTTKMTLERTTKDHLHHSNVNKNSTFICK